MLVVISLLQLILGSRHAQLSSARPMSMSTVIAMTSVEIEIIDHGLLNFVEFSLRFQFSKDQHIGMKVSHGFRHTFLQCEYQCIGHPSKDYSWCSLKLNISSRRFSAILPCDLALIITWRLRQISAQQGLITILKKNANAFDLSTFSRHCRWSILYRYSVRQIIDSNSVVSAYSLLVVVACRPVYTRRHCSLVAVFGSVIRHRLVGRNSLYTCLT